MKPAVICGPIRNCQYDRSDQYAVRRKVRVNTEGVYSCKEVYRITQFESIFLVQLKLLIFLQDFFIFSLVGYVQTVDVIINCTCSMIYN
jgi:hypothetical protein